MNAIKIVHTTGVDVDGERVNFKFTDGTAQWLSFGAIMYLLMNGHHYGVSIDDEDDVPQVLQYFTNAKFTAPLNVRVAGETYVVDENSTLYKSGAWKEITVKRNGKKVKLVKGATAKLGDIATVETSGETFDWNKGIHLALDPVHVAKIQAGMEIKNDVKATLMGRLEF